jgi:hypothetical protein
MRIIESESGTYTAPARRHDGYYAGDFSRTPFEWTRLYTSETRPRLVSSPVIRTAR